MKDLADQRFLRAACAKIKGAAVFFQGNYKSPFSSRFKETKSLLFLTDAKEVQNLLPIQMIQVGQ